MVSVVIALCHANLGRDCFIGGFDSKKGGAGLIVIVGFGAYVDRPAVGKAIDKEPCIIRFKCDVSNSDIDAVAGEDGPCGVRRDGDYLRVASGIQFNGGAAELEGGIINIKGTHFFTTFFPLMIYTPGNNPFITSLKLALLWERIGIPLTSKILYDSTASAFSSISSTPDGWLSAKPISIMRVLDVFLWK